METLMLKATRHPGLFRAPDGKWKIRATAVCRRTGKLKEATKTLPANVSEADALSQLARIKQQLAAGTDDSVTPSNVPSVADYAKSWLTRKVARVRPSVATNYEAKLSLFILPHLGNLRLSELTRGDIESWVAQAERSSMRNGQPYARETVNGWWRVLSALVKDAVAEFNLPIDPTARVKPPRVRTAGRREKSTLTAEELTRLLNELRSASPDRYAEVYLLASSGMRAGELYALTWDDIDETRGRILIRKSVWNGHLDSTKTNSPREAALTTDMVAVLRQHRAALAAAGHRGQFSQLLFPSNVAGYRTATSLLKPLTKAAQSAGITTRVTPQVLRRTVNTLLLLSGVDRIVIRSQLGHVSEQMTERYAGVGIQAKHEALARLGRRGKGEASAAAAS